MKLFSLGALVVTILFAGMSEISAGTFSTTWNYIVANTSAEILGEIVKSNRKIVGRWGVGAFDVSYKYVVNGMEYTGSQVNYNSKTYKYKEILDNYTLGKSVTVYYDPSNPKYSTLERSDLGSHIYGQFIVLIICYVFFTWLSYLYSSKKIAK